QRLQAGLGPWGAGLNAGQVYVSLARLERAGLVLSAQVGQAVRPDRRVYELTAAGHDRVAAWVAEVDWPKPAPAELHLKLIAVAAAGLADPVAVADAQRRELLRRLHELEQTLLREPEGSTDALLLEGAVLHLQAGITWLERCASHWSRARPTEPGA
ncbi:MAG: PadR family transcriptional regulator, partial [Sporichthyaceae bacterium]|nr:PadR family transcriptional regulator [Sporichthyaceae bacterium]